MESYKVLIVDDEEVIAQSTAEYFNMFDTPSAYVTSFDDAVSFLDDHMVSLLLLDITEITIMVTILHYYLLVYKFFRWKQYVLMKAETMLTHHFHVSWCF